MGGGQGKIQPPGHVMSPGTTSSNQFLLPAFPHSPGTAHIVNPSRVNPSGQNLQEMIPETPSQKHPELCFTNLWASMDTINFTIKIKNQRLPHTKPRAHYLHLGLCQNSALFLQLLVRLNSKVKMHILKDYLQ